MPFTPTRFNNPFNGTLKGGIATVGNTLGLWGMYSPPDGSVRLDTVCDGIGCFTTTDTSQRFHSSYPYGTTGDWRQNSSSNILTFSDAGSNTLVGAYLFYSGTAQTKEFDLKTPRTIETTAVTLTTPKSTYSIVPDVVSYATGEQTGNPEYSAFKNITNDPAMWTRFKNETAGTYTLAGVPAALGDNMKSYGPDQLWETSYVGWTLVVVYHNPSAPTRNINVWDIFMLVDFFDDEGMFSISGFCTPPVGNPIHGKMFVSAAGACNFINGDQLRFGPNASSLTNLSGPNNDAMNFFQSQINSDIDGTLTTSGTFGSRNQPVNTKDVLPSGRFGWDKTMINIDNLLSNQQQSASIEMICETITPNWHDVHNMVSIGLQIDLMSANMTGTKTITPTVASVGDILTYTIKLNSTGTEPAHDLVVKDLLGGATNLSFVTGSLEVDGVSHAGNPLTGINLAGPYPNGSSVTITFKVRIDAIPVPNPFTSAADITYKYTPGCSMEAVAEPFSTNLVSVIVQDNIRGVQFI